MSRGMGIITNGMRTDQNNAYIHILHICCPKWEVEDGQQKLLSAQSGCKLAVGAVGAGA